MGILRTAKHQAAYRLMSKTVDRVFAVSEQVRRHVIDEDHVPSAKVCTVYNGLDISAWETGTALDRTQSGPHITTVGNIRRVKGHDLLIHAAASVIQHFPTATFSIVGEILETEYFHELEKLVDQYELTSHFSFCHGVGNLQLHLQKANLFVLPSRSEGFSNAILEAMANSLPVIATDVGGNAEAVVQNTSGIIIPPENPTQLAAAIERLLSDPEQAVRMGENGKIRVREHFSTEAMMQTITDNYAELLE